MPLAAGDSVADIVPDHDRVSCKGKIAVDEAQPRPARLQAGRLYPVAQGRRGQLLFVRVDERLVRWELEGCSGGARLYRRRARQQSGRAILQKLGVSWEGRGVGRKQAVLGVDVPPLELGRNRIPGHPAIATRRSEEAKVALTNLNADRRRRSSTGNIEHVLPVGCEAVEQGARLARLGQGIGRGQGPAPGFCPLQPIPGRGCQKVERGVGRQQLQETRIGTENSQQLLLVALDVEQRQAGDEALLPKECPRGSEGAMPGRAEKEQAAAGLGRELAPELRPQGECCQRQQSASRMADDSHRFGRGRQPLRDPVCQHKRLVPHRPSPVIGMRHDFMDLAQVFDQAAIGPGHRRLRP